MGDPCDPLSPAQPILVSQLNCTQFLDYLGVLDHHLRLMLWIVPDQKANLSCHIEVEYLAGTSQIAQFETAVQICLDSLHLF